MNITRFFRLGTVCRVSLSSLWGASAVGHAILMAARWNHLSLAQVLMISVAIVMSVGLAWLSRWMLDRPARLMAISLLVCMAHTPMQAESAQIFALLPVVVAALGIAALDGFKPVRTAPRMPLRFARLIACDVCAPRALSLCFDLQSRPPPAC